MNTHQDPRTRPLADAEWANERDAAVRRARAAGVALLAAGGGVLIVIIVAAVIITAVAR